MEGGGGLRRKGQRGPGEAGQTGAAQVWPGPQHVVLGRRVLEVPEPGLSSHCGPGTTQARGQRIEEDPEIRLVGPRGRGGWERKGVEGQQEGQHAHAQAGPCVARARCVSRSLQWQCDPRGGEVSGGLAAHGHAEGVRRPQLPPGRVAGGGQALLVGAVGFLLDGVEATGAQGSPEVGAAPPGWGTGSQGAAGPGR